MVRWLIICWLIALTLPGSAQGRECSLCRRTDPPHPLKEFRYTEARSTVNLVCTFCEKEKPRCDICRAPTAVNRGRDDRHICPECTKVAISTDSQIESLYVEVRLFVHRLTGMPLKEYPPVRLVEQDEMATRWTEVSHRSFQTHAFYQAYNPEQIYVLSGHSASDLGPTLAHEYTHAWQSRLSPPQDRQLKEGFATWVEYKYALSKGYQWKVDQILRKNDFDYGQGLQRCLEIEKREGIPGLIKFVTTAERFPEKR